MVYRNTCPMTRTINKPANNVFIPACFGALPRSGCGDSTGPSGGRPEAPRPGGCMCSCAGRGSSLPRPPASTGARCFPPAPVGCGNRGARWEHPFKNKDSESSAEPFVSGTGSGNTERGGSTGSPTGQRSTPCGLPPLSFALSSLQRKRLETKGSNP